MWMLCPRLQGSSGNHQGNRLRILTILVEAHLRLRLWDLLRRTGQIPHVCPCHSAPRMLLRSETYMINISEQCLVFRTYLFEFRWSFLWTGVPIWMPFKRLHHMVYSEARTAPVRRRYSPSSCMPSWCHRQLLYDQHQVCCSSLSPWWLVMGIKNGVENKSVWSWCGTELSESILTQLGRVYEWVSGWFATSSNLQNFPESSIDDV